MTTCTHAKLYSPTLDALVCPDCGAIEQRKRSKYGNRKTEADGFTFDSKREASEWERLRACEQRGEIRNLRRQVPYELKVDGQKVCTYRADFVFEATVCGYLDVTLVVDAKGVRTREYLLKKRLMRVCHGLEIHEV